MAVLADLNVAGKKLTTRQVAEYFGNREFDACGLGAVISTTGEPQQQVISRALSVLANLEHRGAEAADGKSGDGAGILLEVPQNFFRRWLFKYGQRNGNRVASNARVGVGQIFLPREKQHGESYKKAQAIVEEVLNQKGFHNIAWRKPETNSSVLGVIAAQTEPDTRQVVFEMPKGDPNHTRETEAHNRGALHDAMLEIEARIAKENDPILDQSFYINSLSDRTIVYKAMVKPSDLENYHLDLKMIRSMPIGSRVAIVHQRFATNALPNWKLAHPYRHIAHNGEINTIGSTARHAEARMQGHVREGHKAIQTSGSDTAQLDTIVGKMIAEGIPPLEAATFMLPQADHPAQSDDLRTFGRAIQALSDQADGPAGIAITDGRQFAARVDRNGLRPVNYVRVPDEGILIVSSEAGIGLLPTDKEIVRGILDNGDALAVDLSTGRFMDPAGVRQHFENMSAPKRWAEGIKRFTARELIAPGVVSRVQQNADKPWLDLDLSRKLGAAGFMFEDAEQIIPSHAEDAKEHLFSMGNTRPLPVFSPLHGVQARITNLLTQNFAQVTNPPVDPNNERGSFDMLTRLGDRGDIVSFNPANPEDWARDLDLIELDSPLLTRNEFDGLKQRFDQKGWKTQTFDATFNVSNWKNIEERVDEIVEQARKAVQNHRGEAPLQVVISHAKLSEHHAMIPGALIVSAIDRELKIWKLRHRANIHFESADVHDTHSLAMNITSGADTAIPFLAEEIVVRRYPDNPAAALGNFKKGMHAGVEKIMSKMGITTLNSYRGGHIMSAMGLDRGLTLKYFGEDVASPISGLTMRQLGYSLARNHMSSMAQYTPTLRPGSLLRTEADGDPNVHTQRTVRLLQDAVDPSNRDPWTTYEKYEAAVNEPRFVAGINPQGEDVSWRQPFFPRDLFGIREAKVPTPREEVQSVADIISNHMAIAAMSYGALGKPAIIALNEAGTRLNLEVNSGEGGEDPDLPSHQKASTKQVASGRFGVTVEYLNSGKNIQIKMAQGAKPGEGGQLMGEKVNEAIAKNRLSTPGVSLISPPPHHDIYSIEDLAQLIRDLKAVNPEARISVKLVSQAGVGVVAAGVSKCGANEVHVSGHDGGTGAASVTSINNAGWPWEIGVANTQQVLVENAIRDRAFSEKPGDLSSISTDGSMRTGRDVVIAAILGARKVSFGTSALVSAGCLLVRSCQSNTCPVGIATQDPAYQAMFHKDATDRVVNFFQLMGQDVQNWLVKLGVKSLDELRGRTDLLTQLHQEPETKGQFSPAVRSVDLSPILHVPDEHALLAEIRASRAKIEPKRTFDQEVLDEITGSLSAPDADPNNTIRVSREVTPADLNIGTQIGGTLYRLRRDGATPPNVVLETSGFSGQSLGAFLPKGVEVIHTGDAQDFVGKGLNGGTIAIRQSELSGGGSYAVRAGNAIAYGATGGDLFIDGRVGGRAGVRNSNANIVTNGAGAFASEYMTGGMAVYLGPVGANSFTGSSGGINFVYDPRSGDGIEGSTMVNNPATGIPFNFDTNGRTAARLGSPQQTHDEGYEQQLRALLLKHHAATNSEVAAKIVGNWAHEKNNFWIVIPNDYARERRKMIEAKMRTQADAPAPV